MSASLMPIPGLSLAGLTELAGSPPRALIEWAASLGYRAVQLDASLPGLRPRELDRSARRDLAALLRRSQLGFCGLDLWIPAAHFTDPAHQDRAVSAVSAALELASELARLLEAKHAVVSTSLPEKPSSEVLGSICSTAERVGATLADHQFPLRAADGGLGTGVDPALIMAARGDPAGEVSRLGAAPSAARVSDFSSGMRVSVGQGGLDLLAYQVALATSGYEGFAVVDLRGLHAQEKVAKATLRALQPLL